MAARATQVIIDTRSSLVWTFRPPSPLVGSAYSEIRPLHRARTHIVAESWRADPRGLNSCCPTARLSWSWSSGVRATSQSVAVVIRSACGRPTESGARERNVTPHSRLRPSRHANIDHFVAPMSCCPEQDIWAAVPFRNQAYSTGWRVKSELLSHQRSHVDLVNGWLRLEPGESKNGEGRQFPLTPELHDVLERQLARTREIEKATGQVIPWLFHRAGKPIKSFRRAWLRACTEAGVPDRIPHDSSRSAVRNLERAGVSRSAAMKMVGHKTQSIYSRYAIADESMLQDGGTRLSALHAKEAEAARVVVPIGEARSRSGKCPDKVRRLTARQ